jgi:hypothetical protein
MTNRTIALDDLLPINNSEPAGTAKIDSKMDLSVVAVSVLQRMSLEQGKDETSLLQ